MDQLSDAAMSSSDEVSDAAMSSSDEFTDVRLYSGDTPDMEVSPRSRSELLSLARRLYPGESEEKIMKRSNALALVSDKVYTLYEMSCSVCHQHRDEYYYHLVPVKRLNANCDFCGILRKCQQHFAKDAKSMQLSSLGFKTDIQICYIINSRDYCENIHVQLYSKESDVLESPFQCAKDVCESADSIASMSIMREWINRCKDTHRHAPPKHRSRPTRLIDIGGHYGKSHRLCSPEFSVKFAALSYRWGSGKQSETTKENVKERFKKLMTSEFPKTLQDAIQVARGLGLEYIWIDRICIVQDDEEEWANEASLMADIYASAYVVLSATATEDSKDGFLRKRLEPLVIRYAQHGQPDREVRARQIESHDCRRYAMKQDYTLFQRGWCMQERFLARRIIHFLPNEILFECEYGRECECGAASKEMMVRSVGKEYWMFASLRAAPQMTGYFMLDWMEIVRAYSMMELTYGKDSLPALSGVAACIEHLKPGKYIAGLWEHHIVYQLGWYVNTSPATRRWKYPEDVDILGPTFSWSSHVHSINIIEPYDDAQSICTLGSFQVHPATSNPYGPVLHASLCLRGWVVPGHQMIMRLPTYGIDGDKRKVFVYLDSGYSFDAFEPCPPVYSGLTYEGLQDKIAWKSVVCFGLWKGSKQDGDLDALLMQLANNGKKEYVRIGLISGLDSCWFDEHAVASTVTLV